MNFPYHSVEGEDTEVEKGSQSATTRSLRIQAPWTIYVAAALAVVTLIATAAVGFLAGRLYNVTEELEGLQRPGWSWPTQVVELDHVPLLIASNRTFTGKPSPETDQAWEGLYPEDHRGVFRWPDDGSKRAGFAGFHQMHCVDAVRKRLYQDEAVKQALMAGADESQIVQPIELRHILHCIEVLRNGVMCHADTTLQIETTYEQGLPAFGATGKCRDWHQMVAWVDERNKAMPMSEMPH